MRVGSVMEWLARHLLPARLLERGPEDDEERHLNRAAVERALRTADTWNERTKANWRADGDA